MTIRIEDDIAWLEGACGVADAEPLFAALREGRVTTADVSSCRSVHAAVAQTLMRFGVSIEGAAPDPFVRDLVAPALERHRAGIRKSPDGVPARDFS
jgi:hypothetical protein